MPPTVQPDVNTVWLNCLRTIRANVSQQSFKTWFEPIKPVKLDGTILTIQVPSQFFFEWLEEHYVQLLSKTIRQELGEDARLQYRIVVENNMNNTPSIPHVPHKTTPTYFKSEESQKEAIKNPFVIPGLRKLEETYQLNPKYTFQTYIEGECNQLARNAGLAVADNPGGTAFNPLVLYGGVGLGKTHLAQAIGNDVKQKYISKKVLYVSSEKFTNHFIEAVRGGSINDFINFYQLVDVLIVEDIQFFAHKDRTQDIFFHIFNHLHQLGKQIILTSDRPPKDLQGMEERLTSRFKWGLTTDLQVPDVETRIAILEMKLQQEGIELDRDVVEYVAINIDTSIRELEGAMISLLAQASLTKKAIDLNLAKQTIKKFISNVSKKDLSIDFIQQVVCDHFEINYDDIVGKTRKREIVQARQLAMYFAKKYTENSLKGIGNAFGGRDHSTVIHACQTVQNLTETDKEFQQNVAEVERQLKMNL